MNENEKKHVLPQEEILNKKEPSNIKIPQCTNLLIKYLQAKGPAARIQATLPNENIIYEIYLESGGLFAKNGSISFQLTAKPIRKWHGDLALTKGSAEVLKLFEDENTVQQNRTDTKTAANRFFSSLNPQEPKKREAEEKPVDLLAMPEVNKILTELKQLLAKYKGEKGKLITSREPGIVKNHILLFENLRSAAYLFNQLLHIINRNRGSNENIHNKGQAVEKLAYTLGDMFSCSSEISRVIMASSRNAKIFIKFYSSKKEELNLLSHSATILVVDDRK